MTTNDTPQTDSSCLWEDSPVYVTCRRAEEELFASLNSQGRRSIPPDSTASIAARGRAMESRQPHEDSLPRKQLWVIVQLDDHGWVLDQVDGQYVDIRLDRVSFPSSSKVIITPHEGTVYRKEEGASGLLSIDGVAVVGEIFCLPPSPERDGIQIHARVDKCKVQRLRNCQHSSGRGRKFDRHTLEISTPVDYPHLTQERIAYRCGLSRVTDAELRDHSSHVIPPGMGSAREIVTYSFHWRGTPSPDASNRASAEGFTRQDCRFFQENEYLRCGVNPCGPCEGCGDYAKSEVE